MPLAFAGVAFSKGAEICQKPMCPYNYRFQRDSMKQVPYPKPAIVRPHHAQFSCLDDLALGICEPLAYSYVTRNSVNILIVFSKVTFTF